MKSSFFKLSLDANQPDHPNAGRGSADVSQGCVYQGDSHDEACQLNLLHYHVFYLHCCPLVDSRLREGEENQREYADDGHVKRRLLVSVTLNNQIREPFCSCCIIEQ